MCSVCVGVADGGVVGEVECCVCVNLCEEVVAGDQVGVGEGEEDGEALGCCLGCVGVSEDVECVVERCEGVGGAVGCVG